MITSVEMSSTPLRSVKAKVELYKGSTLANTFRYNGDLVSVEIERTGEEGKFFGFGITQKAKIKIRDAARAYAVEKGDGFKVYLGATDEEIDFNTSQPYYPTFYAEEIKRDEKTNSITITAYDLLYKATAHTVAEISLPEEYPLEMAVGMMIEHLGCYLNYDYNLTSFYNLTYPTGANIEGTETAKEIFTAAAEATQSIYFMKCVNGVDTLYYKRLDFGGAPALTITKADYMELTSEDSRTITAICSATELGDNVIAKADDSGETQYIRNNPFWELREDINILVEEALANILGMSITPFTLKWRGNYLLECGDKISIEAKDGTYIESYIVNDAMTYNGGFSQKTSLAYKTSNGETASNPSTLGEVLKQTYARVDKAEKEIELLASETSTTKEAIASLQLNTDGISASVSSLQANTTAALGGVNNEVEELKKKVEATMTSEQVSLQIQNELSSGANKVTTATGFVFDESGLTVSKSENEMKTQITEDGMKVFRDTTEVLTADNVGVKARNLHAETYLIIGTNSRFENYGTNRTGCFWIGG